MPIDGCMQQVIHCSDRIVDRLWPTRSSTHRCVAIGQHRAGLVALLRLRGALFVEDDRHRCRDCVHLRRKGNCAVALRGQMPGVKAWFMPAPNVLQRCHFFHPAAFELETP